MRALDIFLYEFKHFCRSTSKILAYFLFVLACVYAIYNGWSLEKKQLETISNIVEIQEEGKSKMLAWYEAGIKGPEDRPWVDITTPVWALRNSQIYTIKHPSPLLPLGLGQAEQYGFYKQIITRSSTFDNDMVEEIANPERLVNGNIDFSFLLIYLLPLLFIIFTYNIFGLEQDLNFERLVHVQSGSTKGWILARLSFYIIVLISTIALFILITAFFNHALQTHSSEILSLILLSTAYILFWALLFFFIIVKSAGSSSAAFKMISLWLMLCVLIPGAVHQFASLKFPANYMIDFLDVSRDDANAIMELPADSVAQKLMALYPDLKSTIHGKDSVVNAGITRVSASGIINQLNKEAIHTIELQNEAKNRLIESTYWFNPVSMIQNKWNSVTASDYHAYKAYRNNVQEAIDKINELLVFDTWNKKQVDKTTYEYYNDVFK